MQVTQLAKLIGDGDKYKFNNKTTEVNGSLPGINYFTTSLYIRPIIICFEIGYGQKNGLVDNFITNFMCRRCMGFLLEACEYAKFATRPDP